MEIKWKQIGNQLLEHLEYSLTAILIASTIGFLLAVIIFRNKWISSSVIQITSILQTVPSLALFGILIPLIPNIKIIIILTLTLYGIFPIVANSVIGLKKPQENTIDAAKSLAMSKFQIMWMVRFRIGLPSIIGGIRISATLIIGVTTMAAVIGGGGLGEIIWIGINRKNIGLVLQGAIPVAVISILIAKLLQIIENMLQGKVKNAKK